ncbi:hypothetical protein [Ralstonia pseudosolanacearum]|uniref:Uncharacterized protein n=1 Tax=Ralstonia nicotianae (strain ATCC BAA-1114 / GMI1000) TaxID=267608 RepID=Q8XY60_RALN1|nr:hypothetical protein [Ralstonia pseudosolanacearum]MCQ4681205.1 hypothetical protein [Ralstonia pseudosolanacearum]MDC6285861.1 hypothetical protein [Ralstonia pseudosolanacearum]CAD15605.1 hypothetical protein RSc1903 [Ralstonia pseudosolanacearum GMI1000]
MPTIHTSLCQAKRVEVGPVRFDKFVYNDATRVFATQDITICIEGGSPVKLTIHLGEGCTALAAGEAVVLPLPEEVGA